MLRLPMMTILTLDKLAFGKEAVITQLMPESLPFRRRLLAMGITPGCKVSVVRTAPLGDPLEIKTRGFYLCLRRSEAKAIGVVEV
jgi:ferrous iron transport protein A